LWWLDLFKFSIQALIFTLVILLFLPENAVIKISDKSVLTKWGKLSYGLYVYHIIWIHVVFKIYRNLEIELNNWPDYIVFAVITFVGTLFTAYLSYRYFEMPILRLRERRKVSKNLESE